MVGQTSKRTGAADRNPQPPARSRSRSKKDDEDVELDDDGREPLDLDEEDPADRRKDPLRR